MKDWKTVEPDVFCLLGKHYTPGRSRDVDRIIIHHNAGNLTVEGCYSVWQTRQASAHYQVESGGRIGQLVYDRDTAWHCPDQNARAIGIEHANNCFGPWTVSDAALENGAHLVAALCIDHGLGRPQWGVNVFGHNDFHATTCPGELGTGGSQNARYMERAQYWYDAMTGALDPEPEPEPATPLPDALKGYTDLDPDAWYIPAVEECVREGFMGGYGADRFGPDDALTRGQCVCVLANVARADLYAYLEPFDDVSAVPYYYVPLVWALDQGYVDGTQAEFRPDDAATRAELAAFLWRWKGEPEPAGEPAGYPDWADVPEWAKKPVAWAVEHAVMGNNGSAIRPNDAVTRAEAAAMVSNLL